MKRLHMATTYVEGVRYRLVILNQDHADKLAAGQAVAFDYPFDDGVMGRLVLVAAEDTNKSQAEMQPFMDAVLYSLIDKEDDERAEMS